MFFATTITLPAGTNRLSDLLTGAKAGAAQTISGLPATCVRLGMKAATANTAPLFIGGSDVSASNGYELAAGTELLLQATTNNIGLPEIYLNGSGMTLSVFLGVY
ncbi:MAG: hypothetical protein ACRD22_06365 [Terriglobia bacterium]